MRLNKFIANATGLSRRSADALVDSGIILVNGLPPEPGQDIVPSDIVTRDGQPLQLQQVRTIMLHKPVGYVVSRNGQGSQTVYDLLPREHHGLKPVGRLDKDSSGLLLLTSDGLLADQLTHPRYQKEKTYLISLDKPLTPTDVTAIMDGIPVEGYVSRLHLQGAGTEWTVTMRQGKNRQIRRTFAARGYTVVKLHRTVFGDYRLGQLAAGQWEAL